MLIFFVFLLAADSPTQLLQRGLLALQSGDLVQARTAFEQAAKDDPHNAFAWASLAETYARLKQLSAAETAASKAEKFGGENPAIDHALAMYYAKAGQFAHAAELEQKFAASERSDAGAEGRVAGLLLNAGRMPEALAAAEKAMEEHPSASAEDVLGRALVAVGQPAEGEKHLAAAWEAQKNDAGLAFDYSQALLRTQAFDKAAEVISTALETHPDEAQLTLALGVARYGQRRFDDAIGAFLKVIRIDPQVEQPYAFLGKMLDQAGERLPEITAACEQWSARNPGNATALLLLAKARLASDSKDGRAEGLLRRSIKIDGSNWEAHYELGVVLEDKRDWNGALAELKKSAELTEKQAMPHYHLARVYDRLGEGDKAQAERAIHEKLISP